jgi:hypothetical protein
VGRWDEEGSPVPIELTADAAWEKYSTAALGGYRGGRGRGRFPRVLLPEHLCYVTNRVLGGGGEVSLAEKKHLC